MTPFFTLLLTTAAHAQTLACPAGTGPLRTTRPGGLVEDGCARVGGIPHGPSVVRDAAGTIRERGTWSEGARSGEWRTYDAAGHTLEVGSYVGGARTGTWTTLASNGRPVATVFHDPLSAGAPGRTSPDPRVRWATGPAPVLRVESRSSDEETMRPGPPEEGTGGDPEESLAHGYDGHHSDSFAGNLSPWGDEVVRVHGTGLLALDLADGSERWKSRLPDGPGSGPVMSRRFLAMTTGSGMVLVVDPDAGRQVRIRTEAGATHVAAVDQDTVWVRDGVGRIAAWSWLDGRVRWQSRRSYGRVAPTFASGAVVAGRGRDISALDEGTGVRRWSTRLDSEVAAIAPGRDGTVLVTTRSGAVERLSGRDGAPLETLRSPGSGQVMGLLRDEASGPVLRTAHAVGRLGTPVVDGFATRPDLQDGLACGGSVSGGLRCRAPGASEDRLRLHGVHPRGGVELVADLLLVPTQAGVVAIDLAVALATSAEPVYGLPVVLQPQGFPPTETRLPFDVVSRPGVASGCTLVDGVLDLGPAAAILPVLEDGTRPSFSVRIPVLQVDWEEGDPEWSMGPEWSGDLLDSRWEATYTVGWRPELLAVTPFDGSPSAAAALDRLLACTGPGATFRGQAIAVEAGRRVVVEGGLTLQPWAHEVDGQPGCLVDLAVDGEDLGPFRPTSESGWIDVHIAQEGGDTAPRIPGMDVPLPAGFDSGELIIETLLPGALEREELGFETPASVGLEDAWPSGLDLVVRDASETEFLRFPGDDLRLSGPAHHTEWWALQGMEVPPGTEPGPSTLWSRSDCDGAEGASP